MFVVGVRNDPASVAMIGAAGQDGDGAVDLLGQHHPRQSVGPGLRAEGQGLVSGLEEVGIETVGAADDQHQSPDTVIAQGGDPAGEGAAGPDLAMLIAGDDMGVLQMGGQDLGLGGLARFAGLYLDHLDGTQAQGATGSGGALDIVGGQDGLRGPSQPSDSQQRYLQLAALMWLESTDQIFSML
jgi:hypothetical protein